MIASCNLLNTKNLLSSDYTMAVSEIAERLGQRVRRLRRKNGWSQEVLAKRAGLTRPHVAKIEKGLVKHPRIDTLMRLSRALGVSVQELIGPPKLSDGEFITTGVSRDDFAKWFSTLPRELQDDLRTNLSVHSTSPNDQPVQVPDVIHLAKENDGKEIGLETASVLLIPERDFIEGDFDYPQSWRGGRTKVNAASQAGGLTEHDSLDEEVSVLNPTLRDVQSGRYGVIRVKGMSMFPRLKDGDLVLIDRADKTPSPKRVMAVYVRGSGSALGIVHRVGSLLVLAKANPEFPPVILPEDTIIEGVVKKRLEEEFE